MWARGRGEPYSGELTEKLSRKEELTHGRDVSL